MIEHEIRADAVRERTARLSSDWYPVSKPRRRVRLTLGRWLIGAGRRSAPSRAQVSRMKPCRAAETSATASGNNTRMASRRAPACSSALPLA